MRAPFTYRFWDPSSKKMWYSNATMTSPFLLDTGDGSVYDRHGCPYDERLIPSMFTGKRDIENYEIYDGDIVEFVYALQCDNKGHKDKRLVKGEIDCFGVYEVFYAHRAAGFALRCHKKNWLDHTFRTEEEAKRLTIDPLCPVMTHLEHPLSNFGVCNIIGNVFENPELLTK